VRAWSLDMRVCGARRRDYAPGVRSTYVGVALYDQTLTLYRVDVHVWSIGLRIYPPDVAADA